MKKIREAIRRLIRRAQGDGQARSGRIHIPVRSVPWGRPSPRPVPVRVRRPRTGHEGLRAVGL